MFTGLPVQTTVGKVLGQSGVRLTLLRQLKKGRSNIEKKVKSYQIFGSPKVRFNLNNIATCFFENVKIKQKL